MKRNKTGAGSWGRASRTETVAGIAGVALFLLMQGMLVGVTAAHWTMVALFGALYFAHPMTRKLAIALLPFVAFEICYDWMRIYPNYMVNEVDCRGLYNTELQLFGIKDGGAVLIPGQYFTLHYSTLADLFAGFFYLCWVPVPIAFGLWLFFKGQQYDYLKFALTFLLVNLIGFAGYYIHPAAPPWYVLQYGFSPVFDTPGNVAGLGRFDELVGIPVFHSIYVNNSNVFAAVPSLHAAYMLIATLYALISRQSRKLVVAFSFITVGIWWTAVYTCHHYIIDVILGIVTAVLGFALFEFGLMRFKGFRLFIDRYKEYIS